MPSRLSLIHILVAVQDFNLHIADKEFIVLVGPSGCGKSTTLRMIAGLEDISGGELYIDGKLMNDVAVSYTHLVNFRQPSRGRSRNG